MEPDKENKHHFLFYIFQLDRKQCMIDTGKTNFLKQWFGVILNNKQKGEENHE